jgi:hypothetical protein
MMKRSIRRTFVGSFAILSVLAPLACQDAADPARSSELRAVPSPFVLQGAGARAGEALLHAMAAREPAFGGYFFSPESDELVVLATSNSARLAAVRAVRELAGEYPLDGRRATRVLTPSVRTEIVAHTFLQLANWRDVLSGEVFAEGALALYIDIPRNGIVVAVIDEAAVSRVQQLSARLGVRSGVVSVVSAKIGNEADAPVPLLVAPGDSLTSLLRPTDGGAAFGG